jgi:IMP cyclohydrolase
MKGGVFLKKKIVFSCLALLFLFSSISGFCNGVFTGAIGCLVLAVAFGFLSYRSFVSKCNEEHTQNGVVSSGFTPRKNFAPADTATNLPVTPAAATPVPEYEFVQIKISGVTFKNENGSSRQSILRKINFQDEPFNEYVEVELRSYEYDNAPAYAVYANNLQIGNVPADKVQFVSDNFQRLDSISAINVYGGGRSKEGKPISYGCEITLKFRNNIS